jgi:uncharacterized secreted protein with C-terminal beta-propeller domain
MTFVSVTADLPTRDRAQAVEIMFYVTRVANLMFNEDRTDFEAKLLFNIRARFGKDIQVTYVNPYGEECDPQVTNSVRIHLVEEKPTVH